MANRPRLYSGSYSNEVDRIFSLLSILCSLFSIPYSLFPIPYSLFTNIN
ncbi:MULTISPECIES: hypothetical protein [unclassified Moorena]|nr:MULTISPECIES: hypothetical protein [unclassified Moorena]NEO12914.1 hypothetical protein [Moorena sp. SIO3E8]NEP99916.1 hypothetical protein [Moorena sp. SIO3F7]